MARSFSGVEAAWVVEISARRLDHAVTMLGDERLARATDWRTAVEDRAVDAVFVALPTTSTARPPKPR